MVAKAAKGKAVKAKRVAKAVPRVKKGTLRAALLSGLKADTGRKDIRIAAASAVASKSVDSIPLELRAGFPLKLTKGAVHPKDWVTANGVKIVVDTSRVPWLPDDWGQGVKQTQPTARSTGGGGGILTTFVAPNGKTSFFHKATSEAYAGRPLTLEDGWNGQVRRAKLEAKQQVQLARAEGANAGVDNDADLLKVLSDAEQRCLPAKEKLYFAVVSARRATKLEGVRDIFIVQTQLEEAGVCPTWYVDAASLKSYKALGLKAVVGGKLTPSRNKALADAKRQGKVCVQLSDDISTWEYRAGPSARTRDDDELNAAHAAARRLIVSPVAAARFIVAKMRGAEGPKPKLGGVYMLGSCARAFFGDGFQRQHFILGDFFAVEPDSTVRFDEEMTLKEDYGFTAAHIAKYGSVMRCNRMTLSVKHYDNGGGAVTNRDGKGQEERRNIAILQRKFPGFFRKHPRRKNEVVLKVTASAIPSAIGDDGDSDVDGEGPADSAVRPKRLVSGAAKGSVPSRVKKTCFTKGQKVKKTIPKTKGRSVPDALPPKSLLVSTGKPSKASYIAERCKKAAGLTVERALATAKVRSAQGQTCVYALKDLRYDIACGYLALKKARA